MSAEGDCGPRLRMQQHDFRCHEGGDLTPIRLTRVLLTPAAAATTAAVALLSSHSEGQRAVDHVVACTQLGSFHEQAGRHRLTHSDVFGQPSPRWMMMRMTLAFIRRGGGGGAR